MILTFTSSVTRSRTLVFYRVWTDLSFLSGKRTSNRAYPLDPRVFYTAKEIKIWRATFFKSFLLLFYFNLSIYLLWRGVHRVLNKDLSMNKVCARWIPRLLTENEKERRVVASREFLLKNQRDPTFLDRIITVDETWLHYYDPEDKRQSCVWKTAQSPLPKKA